MNGDLTVTNLTALALLALIIMWAIKVAVPLILKDRSDTTQRFLEALEAAREEVRQSHEYRREDNAAMRAFMSAELGEQRKATAGLARAIDRLTVAHVATHKGEDPETALAAYTNGDTLPGERAVSR